MWCGDVKSSERLRQAAARVRRHGLSQHSFEGFNGAVCSLRALGWDRPDMRDGDMDPVVLDSLNRVTGEHIRSVTDICNWNNVRGRTADDVATAFEAAARLAEQRQAN